MNFLDAKKVEFIRRVGASNIKSTLVTDSGTDQVVYFAFSETDNVLREEVNIIFDSKQQVPRKISLSANQYTMNPLDMEIALFRANDTEAYSVIPMDELRTFVLLEPGTSKMVIGCNRDKCVGKAAKIKFSVNYIEF